MATPTVFLFVTGAGSCRVVPDLIAGLLEDGASVYSVVTPGVARVAPPGSLMKVPGNRWVRDYGQAPLEAYPFGIQLVAPCTFNTLNKIAAGIADNLATAMLGDAIGAGCPVIIAPAMSRGQWANPRARMSTRLLEQWGCELVVPAGQETGLTLAGVTRLRAMVGQAASA